MKIRGKFIIIALLLLTSSALKPIDYLKGSAKKYLSLNFSSSIKHVKSFHIRENNLFLDYLEIIFKKYRPPLNLIDRNMFDYKKHLNGSSKEKFFWVKAGARGDGKSADNPAGNITYLLKNYDLSNAIINVYPGEYNETIETFPLILRYPNLTLRGVGNASETILKNPMHTNEVYFPEYYGSIILIWAQNITIEGFRIVDGGMSVFILSSKAVLRRNIFENNTIAVIVDTHHNIVENNIFVDNNVGISIGLYNYKSSNNFILNNVFEKTKIDVEINTANNTIIGNRMSSGIIIFSGLKEATSQIIENNTINGKPIRYYKNVVSVSISEEIGQLILVNTTELKVNYLNITNACMGIEILYSNNIELSYNIFENNFYSIAIIDSENITISNNKLEDNVFGLFLLNTNKSIIKYNKISKNNYGIFLSASSRNRISDNLIVKNKYGVFIMGPPLIGSYLITSSSNNIILRNQFSNNYIGLSFNSSLGGYASHNLVYKNNFINNKIHAIDDCGENSFNSSVVGNYWDNYSGIDQNGDCIGDTPYSVPGIGRSKDYKPLMKPLYLFRGDKTKMYLLKLLVDYISISVLVATLIVVILLIIKIRRKNIL